MKLRKLTILNVIIHIDNLDAPRIITTDNIMDFIKYENEDLSMDALRNDLSVSSICSEKNQPIDEEFFGSSIGTCDTIS